MQSNELLLKIQKEIETPKRDAFNDHGKYYYSSADEVFRVVRDVLMKHKVIFKCDEWKFEVRKTGSISSSKNNQITKRNVQTILIEFTMSLSDDEDVIIKGTYSCCATYTGPQTVQALRTYAMKYWLKSTLFIPTGELDMDSVGQNSREFKPPLPEEI